MGIKSYRLLTMALLLLVLSACGGRKVIREDVGKDIDLSGRWNDGDSRRVSEAMINDCLSHNWLEKFTSAHNGKQPDVIVGKVQNKSHEHINTETFIKDLQRALINAGKVNFVASGTAREAIRSERIDQAKHAAEETQKAPGQEAGADFMLWGSLNSIVDSVEGERVVYYQINLELLDMANNRTVWIGEKKIKKYIENPSVTY
ncbi:MAG: hypothetical protein Kow0090_22480 [Myxococcota bacterium]